MLFSFTRNPHPGVVQVSHFTLRDSSKRNFFIQAICTNVLLELNIRALKLSLCYTLVYGSIDVLDKNAQLI